MFTAHMDMDMDMDMDSQVKRKQLLYHELGVSQLRQHLQRHVRLLPADHLGERDTGECYVIALLRGARTVARACGRDVDSGDGATKVCRGDNRLHIYICKVSDMAYKV